MNIARFFVDRPIFANGGTNNSNASVLMTIVSEVTVKEEREMKTAMLPAAVRSTKQCSLQKLLPVQNQAYSEFITGDFMDNAIIPHMSIEPATGGKFMNGMGFDRIGSQPLRPFHDFADLRLGLGLRVLSNKGLNGPQVLPRPE